ncbi:hypothetical protein ACQY0O_007433 [Thecaphora frezii]
MAPSAPSASASTSSKPSRRADALIRQLADELATANAAAFKQHLQPLQRHAASYGFTSSQCHRLLCLALHGSTSAPNRDDDDDDNGGDDDKINRRTTPPRPPAAIAILKCIVPAPRARINTDALYTILATLGPSTGTYTEAEAGIATSEKARAVAPDKPVGKVGPDRAKIDIRVQAAAIRLLSVLYDSPPVPLNLAATLDPPADESAEPPQPSTLEGVLPNSYLTLAARTALQRCYAVLFHYLDYQALRPHLCYLLCKTTKRKHVKHYRITKLMSLRANSAPEPGLSALLSTYANFYPDLLFPELLGGSGSTSSIGSNSVPGLKYPDNDWLSRVLRCHAKHARRASGQHIESDDDETAAAREAAAARPRKRARVALDGVDGRTPTATELDAVKLPLAVVPNLITIQPQTSLNKMLGAAPSIITELSSLRHLAHSLDRLTLPSQVASMLAPTFGARLMRLAVLSGATISNDVSLSQDGNGNGDGDSGGDGGARASDYCWVRLSDWLESVVRDEVGLATGKGAERMRMRPPANRSAMVRLASLLVRARQTFDAADEIPERFEETLCRVMRGLADVATVTPNAGTGGMEWNEAWEALCLEMVSFVPLLKPRDWKEFNELVMDPLQRLCGAPAVSDVVAAGIVEALADMVQRWGGRDWDRICRRLDRAAPVRWGISLLSPQLDPLSTLSSVCHTLSLLCDTALLHHPYRLSITHATLRSYETFLSPPLSGLHTVAFPSSLVFYLSSVCATSLMPQSRMLGIVHRCRMAFEQIHPIPDPPNGGERQKLAWKRKKEWVDKRRETELNKAVLVLVDAGWRCRGLERAGRESEPVGFEASLLTSLSRTSETGVPIPTLLSLTHHPASSNLAERFLNHSINPTSTAAYIRGAPTHRLVKDHLDCTSKEFRERLIVHWKQQGARGWEALVSSSVKKGSSRDE